MNSGGRPIIPKCRLAYEWRNPGNPFKGTVCHLHVMTSEAADAERLYPVHFGRDNDAGAPWLSALIRAPIDSAQRVK